MRPKPDTAVLIRTLRENHTPVAITQQALASALGITQQGISAMERGKVEPSVSQFRTIARVCGYDVVLVKRVPDAPRR